MLEQAQMNQNQKYNRLFELNQAAEVQNQISTICVIFRIEKELQRLLGSIHSAVLRTKIPKANFFTSQPPHVPWKSDSCESYFILTVCSFKIWRSYLKMLVANQIVPH